MVSSYAINHSKRLTKNWLWLAICILLKYFSKKYFYKAEMHGSSTIKYTPLQCYCCVVNNIFVYLIGNICSRKDDVANEI